MNAELSITTERVDDIPILTASLERMGVAELIDEHFIVHGNWQGISPGKMMTGRLSHILSVAGHRLIRCKIGPPNDLKRCMVAWGLK